MLNVKNNIQWEDVLINAEINLQNKLRIFGCFKIVKETDSRFMVKYCGITAGKDAEVGDVVRVMISDYMDWTGFNVIGKKIVVDMWRWDTEKKIRGTSFRIPTSKKVVDAVMRLLRQWAVSEKKLFNAEEWD